MAQPYLSVILPAYNESANLQRGVLQEITAYLSAQTYSWELVIVNDGSTDDTAKLIKAFLPHHSNVRFIDNPHQGKAATVMTGVMAAAGEIILFSDMDQATPISEVAKFLPHFDKSDIVIGSRSGRKGAPFLRQILAFGMVFTRTLLLRLPFKDTQCGFKAFKREPARRLFSIMQQIHPPLVVTGPVINAGFDVEMLYLARKLHFKISEVPVNWQYRESKRVSFVKDTFTSLNELLRIRARSLTGAYRSYLS